MAVYGVIFWFLLFIYYDLPKDFRKLAYPTLYTSLEYLFFASFFYFNIKSRHFKAFIIILSGLFITFQLFYVFTFAKSRVDSIPIGIESILIFIFICLFFLETLKTPTRDYVYNNHCFWISCGLLIYLGGSFFINILANAFTNEEFEKYWYFNYLADTIKTLFFGVAFIFLVKESKNKINSGDLKIPNLDMI